MSPNLREMEKPWLGLVAILTVCSGCGAVSEPRRPSPATIVVPQLMERPLEDAVHLAVASGLCPMIEVDPRPTTALGSEVTRQAPNAGAAATAGSRIDLTVSAFAAPERIIAVRLPPSECGPISVTVPAR